MTHPFDLAGQVAIVTGSSRGIGKSAAEIMAQMGAKVVVSSRKADACEDVAKGIRDKGGEAIGMGADGAGDRTEHVIAVDGDGGGGLGIELRAKGDEGAEIGAHGRGRGPIGDGAHPGQYQGSPGDGRRPTGPVGAGGWTLPEAVGGEPGILDIPGGWGLRFGRQFKIGDDREE